MEIRMKQFCRALTCYIRDIGYYQTFTEFMGRIDALSDSIGSEKSTAWKQWSLERLQTEIDLCVNQMMYRSFCHQIMRPVRILILGIFSTVGQYTDLMENATASMDSVMFERSVWEINRSFSEKRKIFLQLIRSIRDKAKQTGADIGSRQSYLQGRVECLEDLLLRF
jgi:hypothetical protein